MSLINTELECGDCGNRHPKSDAPIRDPHKNYFDPRPYCAKCGSENIKEVVMFHPEHYPYTPNPEIEAECLDCGQRLAEGAMPYYQKGNTFQAYCPTCNGQSLEFFALREDYPRRER